jgi:hypothetical protein
MTIDRSRIKHRSLEEADPTYPKDWMVNIGQNSRHPPKSSLRIRWLAFWNYIWLPLGGIIYALSLTPYPVFGLTGAALNFSAAYGLHRRKLWAWWLNWVMVGLAPIGGFLGVLARAQTEGWESVGAWLVGAAAVGLIWLWANVIYWKKRKPLFS